MDIACRMMVNVIFQDRFLSGEVGWAWTGIFEDLLREKFIY
jgi:hypothetical protein